MPDFAYIARDLTGHKITGTLSAATEREAINILSGRSLFPVFVAADKAAAAPGANIRIKPQMMAIVYGQLAALLRSGVPLLKSLAVLREQTSHKKLKAVLSEVHHRVEDGTTLADAMQRFPRAFSEMSVNMIRAGGEGGFLEDALDRVALFTEQQEDLKGRTVSAMVYPVLLGSAGFIVVTVLIVFFVPKFAIMFERLRERGELPWATELLLWISESARSPIVVFLILPALIAGCVFLYMRVQTPEGRRTADYVRIKIPMAGPIFLAFAVARFCRVLGTLLHNGVPILKALEISREASGNKILTEAIAKASENISSGQSLAAPLGATGHCPTMVVEMIAVAEESNTLDQVLVDMADDLEKQTSRQLDMFVRLLEPLMLIMLAGVVLVIVIALLVPVIKMSSTMA